MSVPWAGGGGYIRYIRKALEKGYSEHPGLHAVLMICLRSSSVLDVPVLLAASFCQLARHISPTYHSHDEKRGMEICAFVLNSKMQEIGLTEMICW